MARFIKLTNMLINTNSINTILIQPNKYCIEIISKRFGYLNINDEIEVCKIIHPENYKIITEWIRIGRFE
jgi:hypothetical protein